MPALNLSTIINDRNGSAGDSFPAEYMEMQSMRRAFLRSWAAWVRTGASQRDIRDEAESTASAFRQIGELNFVADPKGAASRQRRRAR